MDTNTTRPVASCLNRRDSAAYLSISIRLLDMLAAAGDLPQVKLGRKTLYRVADLDAFVAARLQKREGVA